MSINSGKTQPSKLKRRLSSASDLIAAGLAAPDDQPELEAVATEFAIGISDHLAAAMPGSAAISAQYLPQRAELITTPAELDDPISDEAYTPVKGIVHRYPDRLLFKVASACAVYCRYCFRREMIGPGTGILSADEINAALDYVRNAPHVREVILTGGDPLILSARQLDDILEKIETIPHIKIMRIHTRVPIADPSRITGDILNILSRKKPIVMALHVNHADEFTPAVIEKLAALRQAGCLLLSQSVLLRGVNDNADVLENLFRTCLEHGIKPYYIHHPDLARGTGHFRLPISTGMAIMKQLQGRLSGIAQASYMLDIPGGFGKIPLHEGNVRMLAHGRYEITDYKGGRHIYCDDLPLRD